MKRFAKIILFLQVFVVLGIFAITIRVASAGEEVLPFIFNDGYFVLPVVRTEAGERYRAVLQCDTTNCKILSVESKTQLCNPSRTDFSPAKVICSTP